MCSFNTAEYDIFDAEKINPDVMPSLAANITDIHNSNPCCKKCGCEDVRVSLRNKNRYCKICFLNLSAHKFRATLGKSKSIHQHDSILIAHSGKANSTLLLHLTAADISESNSKMPRFQCKVLYIDDGAVKGRTVEEREMLRTAFAKEAKGFQLSTYIIPLSKSMADITSDDLHPINTLQSNISNEDAVLRQIFTSLETDTAKDELLHQLRHKLLVTAARMLNCNKVFVADTSVDLAIKVLGDISTGRGSQLPFNVAFSDIRHKDVILLRPLKDFTADDIVGYLDCCKLRPILSTQNYSLLFPTSIRNITKCFVHELDSQFYGTVSTIYRTSEKLATRIDKLGHSVINRDTNVHNACIICELPVDSASSQKEQLSVVQAKLFSELVSTVTDHISDVNSLNVCKESSSERTDTINRHVTMKGCQCNIRACNFLERQKNVKTHLCYSCRLIFFNSKQMDNILPTFIVNAIERKFQTARMRHEIVDFLL